MRDPALPGRWNQRVPVRHALPLRLLLIGDLLAGVLGAAVGLWRSGVSGWWPVLGAIGLGPGLVAVLALAGVYRVRGGVSGHGNGELARWGMAAVAVWSVACTVALGPWPEPGRMLVLTGVAVGLAGCGLVHGAGLVLLRGLRRRGRLRQRVVVLGLERSVAELVRTVRRDRAAGLEVVAACVSGGRSARIEGVPVLGGAEQVLAVLAAADAQALVVTAWSDVSAEELRRLTWELEGSGVAVLVAPRVAEVMAPRVAIRTVGGIPLLEVREPEFTGARRAVKTALDYGLAVLALVLLAPVLLTVAVAVRVSSPGPVLFRQVRVGRHGRPFVMHKFRSMYVDAEQRLAQLEHLNEGGGPLFKLRADPRVTPVGRFIRRYSLDELPQLLDVLLGRMSLVGPRPPLPREVAAYPQEVRRRLLVKPGLTGLWQVSGRSDLSWEESVRLDLSYVENWFLGLDLSIIARTVSAVLARNGAY